jgi:hypothetical protein
MSINLTHEVQEVEIILAGLRKLPMEIVEELVNKIRSQAIPQMAEQKAKAMTAEPAPEVPAETTVDASEAQ